MIKKDIIVAWEWVSRTLPKEISDMKLKKTIAVLCIAAALSGNVAYASDLNSWAMADFESVASSGIMSYNVVKNKLSENITREEFCEMIMNLFKNLSDKQIYTPEVFPFEDSDNIQVAQAYALGIISGRNDEEFDPQGDVTREEMAKIIVNTLKTAEVNLLTLKSEADEFMKKYKDSEEVSPWAMTEVMTLIKYSVISGVSDDMLEPKAGATREQAIAMINRIYSQFAKDKVAYQVPEFSSLADGVTVDSSKNFAVEPIDGAKKYVMIIKDFDGNTVKTAESKTPDFKTDISMLENNTGYTVVAGAEYQSGVQVYSLPVDVIYKPAGNVITVVKSDQKTLNAKELRVFPGGAYFESAEEAGANMETITVDVWTIGTDGEKHAAKKTLSVNKYLAEDVVNIFKEIFESPERFPIKSVGGYYWRNTAFGSVSQHSYGTCIDINPDENYYCYSADGAAITGTHWTPYEDAYSIVPDGSVVAAFAKYGWIWGGSWDGKVKDYMHFTYLGK